MHPVGHLGHLDGPCPGPAQKAEVLLGIGFLDAGQESNCSDKRKAVSPSFSTWSRSAHVVRAGRTVYG